MRLYTGVVENRQDPFKLGRCQVRVVGLHHHDKTQLKTEDLPWAYPMQPITSAAMSGIGHSPVGPVEGTWVVVMFRDDDEQQPIILGSIGGIPQAQGSVDQDIDQMVLKEDGFLPGSSEHNVTDENGNIITSSGASSAAESTGLNPASSYTASSTAITQIKQNNSQLTDEDINTTLENDIYPAINAKIKAPLSQSMYDGLASLVYEIGVDTFNNSSLAKSLNSGNYLEAATAFNDYSKVDGTIDPYLLQQRTNQKDLFLQDGVPSVSGDLVPAISTTTPVDSTTASSGLKDEGLAMVLGFKDPKGKYPLYLNEPDTNKLARHEDIKKTIVYKKELAQEKNVLTAGGKTWNQSPIPYNSSYPYNHVFMTESGHIMEFDDTQHSERIHMYHKAGTFTEIDANGTEVKRIVGDKYEILERHGHLYIKGTSDITIDGDSNVKINNAMNVEVVGNVNMKVTGNMDVDVAGTYNLKAKGVNIESHSDPINVLSANSLNLQSAAAMNQKAGATWNVDAVRVDINDGTAGDANGTGLDTLDLATPIVPTFSDLVVITRGAEAAAWYETPEEGDATAYTAKQINDGTLKADEKDYGTAQGSASAGGNNVAPLPQSCNIISSMSKFTPDLQLSPHFTLGSLTKNGARMPVDQQGMTAQEIVCNLKGLAENCLEPIINLYPSMIITSGFRKPGDVAESSKTSQHYLGQAADIIIPGFSREKHYEAIQAIQQIIPYDQLLLEYSGSHTVWIHVSFKYTANRQMAFTMRDHQRYGSIGTYTLIA
jgi:GH24 family phage-related lysozyme (muramidase)